MAGKKKQPASRKGVGGRPRTTLDVLPDNWEEIMLECGKNGGSEVEMRVLLGVGETAFYTLCSDYPEFSRTRKRAKDLCEVWWERRGRKMAEGDDGNPTVWIFNMKNRFGWRDKQEIDQTVKGEHKHEVKAEIKAVDKLAEVLSEFKSE